MASGRVIVVGSVNVDMVVAAPRLPSPGDTVIGGSFERHGGGKGANKALAAARAGAATVFIGAVGADQAGDESLAELTAAGVDVSRCRRLPGVATGVALIVVDAQGDNQIAVAPGANALLDGASVEAALSSVEPTARDVLLADFEVGPEAVLAAARWAAERDVRLVINPAPARHLEPELLGLGPLLTPNRSEARVLAGLGGAPGPQADEGAEPAEATEAARVLARRSGAPVVVTLGAMGALLVADGAAIHVPGHRVATVDTTGAGDALNGILCAALAREDALPDALRWAVAGAALSTTTAGARGCLPGPARIEQLLLGSPAEGA